jgi:hypothetical protein
MQRHNSEKANRNNKEKLNNIIARDLLVSVILTGIAKDDFIKQRIVLQGGAAMRTAYHSPRRTKDVDFSFFPKISDGEKEEVISRIKENALPPIDGKEIRLEVKGLKTGVYRFTYKIDFAGQPLGVPVEIGTTATTVKAPILLEDITIWSDKYAYIDIPKFNLFVMDRSEMIADKIFANVSRLAERNSFKITDVWDIDQLLGMGRVHTYVTPDSIMTKAVQFWDGAALSQVMEGIAGLKAEIEKNRGKLAVEAPFIMVDRVTRDFSPDFDTQWFFSNVERRTIDYLAAILEDGPRLSFFYNTSTLREGIMKSRNHPNS